MSDGSALSADNLKTNGVMAMAKIMHAMRAIALMLTCTLLGIALADIYHGFSAEPLTPYMVIAACMLSIWAIFD